MNKTIYMSEPLEKLAAETKGNRRNGRFSQRLGEIVGRYQIMLALSTMPDLSEIEMQILGEVLCGAVIDTRKIRGLHLDVLDATIGTDDDRRELSAYIESMSPADRVMLVELLGRKNRDKS